MLSYLLEIVMQQTLILGLGDIREERDILMTFFKLSFSTVCNDSLSLAEQHNMEFLNGMAALGFFFCN